MNFQPYLSLYMAALGFTAGFIWILIAFQQLYFIRNPQKLRIYESAVNESTPLFILLAALPVTILFAAILATKIANLPEFSSYCYTNETVYLEYDDENY